MAGISAPAAGLLLIAEWWAALAIIFFVIGPIVSLITRAWRK